MLRKKIGSYINNSESKFTEDPFILVYDKLTNYTGKRILD